MRISSDQRAPLCCKLSTIAVWPALRASLRGERLDAVEGARFDREADVGALLDEVADDVRVAAARGIDERRFISYGSCAFT